ncbi:hypothetical protein Clacol_006045 [Clathrus columnatus]|uniref:Uncharacterized protein n=1 Tax=Clathrus columnatus TaxID=1419009 RepID=A0AAV5AAZ4_9AGAM|nr:hypothetical protein Clacol_006045 [Clathrus columnatus]
MDLNVKDSEKNLSFNEQIEDVAKRDSIDSTLDSEVDVGYSYFLKGEKRRVEGGENGEEVFFSKKVLKKIDMRILPIISIVYCLQSMDKQGIRYAFPITTPGVVTLKNLTGIVIFLWAVTMMSTAGCTNFTGAMINRFVLGCVEAVVTDLNIYDKLENKHFKRYQVEQALRDPKTYLLFILSLSTQISGGLLTSFRAQIINNMGFSELQSTILGIPSDFIQGICLVLSGYIASTIPNSRIIVMTISNVVCVIAAACMAYLPLEDSWGSIGFSLGLSMVSVNMSGSIQAMLVGFIIKLVGGIILGLYMIWENRRRDRVQATEGPSFDEHEGQRLSLLDKTEFVGGQPGIYLVN